MTGQNAWGSTRGTRAPSVSASRRSATSVDARVRNRPEIRCFYVGRFARDRPRRARHEPRDRDASRDLRSGRPRASERDRGRSRRARARRRRRRATPVASFENESRLMNAHLSSDGPRLRSDRWWGRDHRAGQLPKQAPDRVPTDAGVPFEHALRSFGRRAQYRPLIARRLGGQISQPGQRLAGGLSHSELPVASAIGGHGLKIVKAQRETARRRLPRHSFVRWQSSVNRRNVWARSLGKRSRSTIDETERPRKKSFRLSALSKSQRDVMAIRRHLSRRSTHHLSKDVRRVFRLADARRHAHRAQGQGTFPITPDPSWFPSVAVAQPRLENQSLPSAGRTFRHARMRRPSPGYPSRRSRPRVASRWGTSTPTLVSFPAPRSRSRTRADPLLPAFPRGPAR